MKITTTIVIDIPDFPESVEDWQIYDMPDSPAVAKNLTNALKECFNISNRAEAWKHMYNAMLDHRKYGAADTEPRDVALDVLETYHPAFKKVR
jgi:hypothetical protein